MMHCHIGLHRCGNARPDPSPLAFVDIAQGAAPSGFAVGYGLGIMKFLLPGDVEMIGHAGTTGGYQCFVYSLPTQGITISGMMNNMASDQIQLISPALEILIPGFEIPDPVT